MGGNTQLHGWSAGQERHAFRAKRVQPPGTEDYACTHNVDSKRRCVRINPATTVLHDLLLARMDSAMEHGAGITQSGQVFVLVTSACSHCQQRARSWSAESYRPGHVE